MVRGVYYPVTTVAVIACLFFGQILLEDVDVSEASPVLHPDETLVVDRLYLIDDHEVWGDVVVQSSGKLVVKEGATLATRSIILQGTSDFEVDGGLVSIRDCCYRSAVRLSGRCASFKLIDGARLEMTAPDGALDIATSAGGNVVLDVASSHTLNINRAWIELTAGDGFSPPEPMTRDDLDGDAFSGGDVLIDLELGGLGKDLVISHTSINAKGGSGGRAPDGASPHDEATGGRGGGFTQGGDVSGHVGSGGSVSMTVTAGAVELEDTSVVLVGGPGSRAGDGGRVLKDQEAGAGGGGYTGGDGAFGSVVDFGPTSGGTVTGDAGRGGDCQVHLRGRSSEVRNCWFDLSGGDGGQAGHGGRTGINETLGGSGGGGYSGGGGGGHPSLDGAPGGDVSGRVGTGGDVRIWVSTTDLARIWSTGFCATAGRGADAGDAGRGINPDFYRGGSGGGGYSGGGGGAYGPTDGKTPGTDGGNGGNVSGSVGRGGEASIEIDSFRSIAVHSSFNIYGGTGGTGGWDGTPGWVPGSYSGEGGGSYSGGGGPGNGASFQINGDGGVAGAVLGEVGDGGNATFDLSDERPTVSRSTDIVTIPGLMGDSYTSSGGNDGGDSAGRATVNGTRSRHIPMSIPILLHPVNGSLEFRLPVFDWIPVHDSTTNGAVREYLFLLDDDQDFSSSVMSRTSVFPSLPIVSLPFGTYHWKVLTRYSMPTGVSTRFSDPFTFKFSNSPPRFVLINAIQINERQETTIDFGDYIIDPDNDESELSLACDYHRVIGIEGLNVTFYYDSWVEMDWVPFILSDGINTKREQVPVKVVDVNEIPEFLTVGGKVVPASFTIGERTEHWYEVEVNDPDGDRVLLELFKSWRGVRLHSNGTLHVMARHGEVGRFYTNVIASDGREGVNGTRVTFNVVNVNDPPGPISSFGPDHGSVFYEYEPVTFTVKVDDPDLEYPEWGEVLQVTWESDIAGPLMSKNTSNIAAFVTNGLKVGRHLITVTVSDGEYSQETTFAVMIKEYVGPDDPTRPEEDDPRLVIAVLLILMPLVGYLVGWKGVRYEPRD
jgi:hypothetical protein